MNVRRNFSKQLSYNFDEIDIDNYLYITDAIVKHYQLTKASQLIHGFDETFQDFQIDEKIIGLEWDVWSGYIIIAKNTESEELVKNIAFFIKTIPEKKRMSKKSILIYGTLLSLVLLYWSLN